MSLFVIVSLAIGALVIIVVIGKALFAGQSGGRFGVAGIEYKHTEKVNDWTYEVYTADSLRKAHQFLNRLSATKIPAFTYIMVETPAGNIGKDKNGIFDEDEEAQKRGL